MGDFTEEGEVGRSYDVRLLRRLLAYARPHARQLTLGLVLLLVVSALQLWQPYLVKVAIDRELAGPHGSVAGLWQVALLLLAVLVVGSVLSYIQGVVVQAAGQRIIQCIRQDVFDHVLALGLPFFDRNPVGRLVTRVTNDTEALNQMYTSVLINLFRDVFAIVGTIVIMLRLDWHLALVGFAVMPLVAFTTVTAQRMLRAAWRVVRVRLARINATLAENFSGMRLIQAFNRQDQQLAEFAAINDAHFAASWQQLQVAAVARPILDLLGQVALAGTLWFGGLQAMHAAVELGTLYAFTAYLRQLYNPISELAEKFNIMQAAMASSERLFMLLDTPPEPDPETPVLEIVDQIGLEAPRRLGAAVEFRNVWFSYHAAGAAYLGQGGDAVEHAGPGERAEHVGHAENASELAEQAEDPGSRWVLRDVSFTVKPGQTVAFVGHTGAGKSSIMSLIARFYDVQRGQVLVDGVDVRHWRQADLRAALGVVMQEPFLFTGTVGDNIRLGHRDRGSERAEAALVEAGGAALLTRLPAGLETPVSERGSSMSTGERQLVAFARALAVAPAILILDEATASVDSETERILMEALARRKGGVTTLIVAHRLATVQNADQIVVLHKGRVREVGSHDGLLAQGGLYRQLWEVQAGLA